MRRGTTTTIVYTLPSHIAVNDLVDARITIRQSSDAVISRALNKMTVDIVNNALLAEFSQRETLRLTSGEKTNAQLKVKLIGGAVLATAPSPVRVYEILNEEVL